MINRRAHLGPNIYAKDAKTRQKGSATVEAAIVLPIVMLAFMAVLSIVRIAVTYERMQQSLNQVASQLSQYSYLYTVSGLKEDHDNLNDKANTAIDELTNQCNIFNTFYGELQSLTDNISQVDNSDESSIEMIYSLAVNVNSATGSFEEISQQIESLAKDPMGEIKLIGLALSGSVLSKGKTLLLGTISKSMMKRNLARDLRIKVEEVDEKLRFIEGINNLDMSCSTFFDDNETIDLIAEYAIKPVPDFLFMPEIRLRNRACVLAWTCGVERVAKTDEPTSTDGENIWNLDKSKSATNQHFGRGNKVDKWFAEELKDSLGKNAELTPYHFKTIDLIRYSENGKGGELYAIFSLNPFLPSYLKKSGVMGEIKKNLYSLNEFKRYEVNGFAIDITGYEKHYKRKAYIIVPENKTLPEPYLQALEECRLIADKLGIELKQVQKYGEYEKEEDNETK